MVKFGEETPEGGYHTEGLKSLPILIFWFLYFVLIEAYQGATLGHKALNLLVLNVADRKSITLTQAFKRHILDFIDIFYFGIPAIIAIKNTDKKQRLGDLWAKTIVVDTDDSEQY